MKIAFYSTNKYDKESFNQIQSQHTIKFIEFQLNLDTIIYAHSYDAVCIFVNDVCNKEILIELHKIGIKHVLLRCAGFNNVDILYAEQLGINVVRVPEYSPHAVAEHAVALLLTLNRKIHKAYNRVREGNFNLDGLTGFDLKGKTVGVIGYGKIGQVFAKIMHGFSSDVLVYDPFIQQEDLINGETLATLDELFTHADIISLHCPFNEQTQHLINEKNVNLMKDNVFLINTSRGGLIDTKYIIKALKTKKIGALAIDVYEFERDIFFKDLSDSYIADDFFDRLNSFPNVLITGHQGFLTHEALHNIAEITLDNATKLDKFNQCDNKVIL